MMSMSMTEPTRPAKRSRIPLIFFAFFGVVLIANGIMIYIALSTWTGLETPNSYLKGLDYNKTLEEVSTQNALHWTVDSVVTPVGQPGRFAVSIRLSDKAGAPLRDARVVASFERPTHYGVDSRAELSEVEPGLYVGTVDLTEAGSWNLRRLVWHGEETHQTVERMFLKPENF